MVIHKQIKGGSQIRLLPNRSATWLQTKWVVAVIGCVSLSIGLFWALRGAWVILPFAGLEVFLLGFFAYRVCYFSYHQQVITIEPQQIRVEWGHHQPKRNWTFERDSSEFQIKRPAHSLSPAEIFIQDKDRGLRIGSLLNQEDTEQLINCIRHSGVYYQFSGITRTHAIDGFDL